METPFAYACRQTSIAEKNYTITELKGAAIIFAIEKFRPYLEGIIIEIIRDHHALCFLNKKSSLSPRLFRWAMLLTEYNFEITYPSGKCNKDADCLTRFLENKPTPEADSIETSVGRASVAPVVEHSMNESVEINLPTMKLVELESILRGLAIISTKTEEAQTLHFD